MPCRVRPRAHVLTLAVALLCRLQDGLVHSPSVGMPSGPMPSPQPSEGFALQERQQPIAGAASGSKDAYVPLLDRYPAVAGTSRGMKRSFDTVAEKFAAEMIAGVLKSAVTKILIEDTQVLMTQSSLRDDVDEDVDMCRARRQRLE